MKEKVLRYARRIATSGRLAHSELVTHRDSPDNNECTPFDFSEANIARLTALIANYPEGAQRSALGAALDLVQRQIGWVPISAMNRVAEYLSIPRIRVYEWVTFYTMNKRRYRGKYHVKVCKTLPCMLRGSDTILEVVQQECNCKVGELSLDCMFGVDTVECAGACANAPILVIDDDYYEDVSPCDVETIIRTLKCGGIPRFGPQCGRYAAEPMCNQASLIEPPPGPGFMLQDCLK
ncbi:NADH dehydrogenase [ubiquinone] flavoprotein 2, mitochondrial-like [Pectinophora gossypiella]|uniref:NADH dehydrogenase [ubiquinone] flavoprotein 2, mitochondrial-like n=1 Tax=Pectinophora gossypiella TaxID=13191 RepID=UPI00214EF1D1|nr:NADH dehydrogenase [ubiquinone] flavoprotein 2, mitochondrial-like [Pectinophora gossypiella]